jgi:Ca2+/Na+ antiporter
MTNKTLYILLAVCVAALFYMKRGWESIDFSNLNTQNFSVFMMIVLIILLGLVFLSPFITGKKLAFKEGRVDKKKIFGGKDIT